MRKLISTLSLVLLVFGSILLFSSEADGQKSGGNRRSVTNLGKIGGLSKKGLAISDGPTAIQCNPSGTITVGGSAVNGSLGSGDCQFEDGTYFDLYTLTGNAGDRLTVSMTSTAVDSYLILFDSAGEILLEDDDGLGGGNARLPFEQGVVVLPYTGTYYIGANSFEVASGSYQLTATLPSECAVNTPMNVGSSVSSALTTSDCRTSLDGTLFYAKFYTFSGTTGQQLSFSMSATSGNLDPYLVLRTPSGTGTVEDDAGGGGTAARIPAGTGFVTLPETGTYILEATSAGESETGAFTLSIGQNCSFSISPSSAQTFGVGGGTGSITVSTDSLCTWTAQSDSGWITITSGSSGTGNGTVNFSVSSNTGSARSGAITAGGISVTINQDAAPVGSIAGTVRYYFGQTPVAVPGVNLSAAGSVPVSGTTGSNGTFNLQNLGTGAYTLTPSKTGDATTTAISALDASTVAQFSVQLISLSANQQIAADVTNDGTISALDASRIAQWSVGLNLPAGDLTGTWKFSPSVRNYTSVSTTLTGEDFAAILMGDVTGNWTPSPSINLVETGSMASFDQVASEKVGFGDLGGSLPVREIKNSWKQSVEKKTFDGEVVEIPITIEGATNLLSYDAVISYDSDLMEPVTDRPVSILGSLSSNFNIVVNQTQAGSIRIAGYGVVPVVGDGELLTLRFRIKRKGDASIGIESLMLNERISVSPRIPKRESHQVQAVAD